MTRWADDGGVVSVPKPAAKKPARAKALPWKSKKRQAAQPQIDAVRTYVFHRDNNTCRLAGRIACNGPLTPHHLRKAGQGGKWEPSNLVALCAHANTWVEDNPQAAWELGLVCRRGERILSCWKRMHASGLSSEPRPSVQRRSA